MNKKRCTADAPPPLKCMYVKCGFCVEPEEKCPEEQDPNKCPYMVSDDGGTAKKG